jgi:hypothetical protein
MPAVWRAFPDAILRVIAGPDHERATFVAGKTALLKAIRGFWLRALWPFRCPYRRAPISK